MPYMPTNLYPRNCAIEKKGDNCTVTFLAKADLNDTIYSYRLYLYDFVTQARTVLINHSKGYSPTDIPSNVSINLLDNEFPFDEDNEFQLEVTFKENYLNKGKYYWALDIATRDQYDVWITDGEIIEVPDVNNLKIFPTTQLNSSYQNIYNNLNQGKAFEVTTRGYFDKTTTASEITVSGTQTTIKTTEPFFSGTEPNIIDLYVTIDTTDYKVASITDNKTITVDGVHPLTSTTVFGQYINIYRSLITLNSTGHGFSVGDFFSIYSRKITTGLNYFSVISRTISNFSDIENLDSPVYNICPTYNGKVSWYQYELWRDGKLVDKTEKIYSNKLNYQYNNFYCDLNDSSTFYELKLTVHDTENCDIKKIIGIKCTYKREGTNDKLKCSWDSNKKAIKVDMSDFISSNATIYLNNSVIHNDLNRAFIYEDSGLHILPNAKIEYKQKTEENLEFPAQSNILIKLKLDKHKNGNLFSFGNKTFSIRNGQDKGLDMFVFDTGSSNIYTYDSKELISWNEKKDLVNTQYYLDSNTNYIPDDKISYLKYSNILFDSNFYILITQRGANGTVSVWSEISEYQPKSLTFNSYENIIDGLVLYEQANFKNIKITLKDFSGITINEDSSISCKDEDAFAWEDGTMFLTSYDKGELNISNHQPFPADVTPDNILVYKECSLLNEDNQFLYVGAYPAETKIIYDYGVADEHAYTYHIIKTYKSGNSIRALSEIISQTVTPDYYEIDVFGVKEKIGDNIYTIDKNQKWYFELDALGDDITFNSETSVYSSSNYAKINKTNVNYMSGTVTVKLGKIRNETEYVEDNRHILDKFKKFANSLNVKIIRLKDGHVIPVDIQLKQKKSNSMLVGNPTDITFDWYQIADSETVSLVEYEVE